MYQCLWNLCRFPLQPRTSAVSKGPHGYDNMYIYQASVSVLVSFTKLTCFWIGSPWVAGETVHLFLQASGLVKLTVSVPMSVPAFCVCACVLRLYMSFLSVTVFCICDCVLCLWLCFVSLILLISVLSSAKVLLEIMTRVSAFSQLPSGCWGLQQMDLQ